MNKALKIIQDTRYWIYTWCIFSLPAFSPKSSKKFSVLFTIHRSAGNQTTEMSEMCTTRNIFQNQGIAFYSISRYVLYSLVHCVIDINSIKMRNILKFKAQLYIYLHEPPFQSVKTLRTADCRFSKIRLQPVQVGAEKKCCV